MKRIKLKDISLIHILLIILIAVVFFGLFKTEIRKWNIDNLPGLREKNVYIEWKCKKEEVDENRESYEKLINECYLKGSWLYAKLYGLTKEEKEQLKTMELSGDECAKRTLDYVNAVPIKKEIERTCSNFEEETWFYALGKYWFKVPW